MACDFHTHNPVLPPGVRLALVSVPPECFGVRPSLYSLELHPWYLPGKFTGLPEGFVDELSGAAALGEAGLDRLRGPALEVQRSYLAAALEVAEQFELPVVLHAVRAWPELFSELKRHLNLRYLIHGFRGGPERLTELLERGFYVSLGRAALRDEGLTNYLKHHSFSRLGFESDASGEAVTSVLEFAVQKLGRDDLEKITDVNFQEFIKS